MKLKTLHTLPIEVQDLIWEVISDENYIIENKFSLTFEQFDFINQLEDDIILKKINVIYLPKELEKIPGEFKGNFRELALQMAIKIFWPLQEYLGGVDRLILRLGGKVPKLIPLIKKDSKHKDILGNTFRGSVKFLMSKYEEFKELSLTPNKIIDEKGKMVNPSIQNWVKDYIHFLGAGTHSSLDRSKYISKSTNVLNLSEEHKNNLLLLLLSYDEGIELYFDRSDGFLVIKEQLEKKSREESDDDYKLSFDKVLTNFKNILDEFQENLISSSMILSEASNDINKVRDVLWNAIGIGDKDKAISCVRLLVEKKYFDSMIKDDSRFRNILKRFIGIKYGQNMEKSLDENMDQLIVRRIFLEMFLLNKLSLKEDDVYVAAYYLTNILPDSGQVVYLDKRDKKFKWREIQVLGNKFAWVDKI